MTVKATRMQRLVAVGILDDLQYENADDVIFSLPDDNGVITYTWIGGERDGETYYIYPDGDISS